MDFNLYKIVISFIPIILAITIHEFAHGWAAKRYGDNTAFSQGRVTLNPLNHIDPIGTVLVPILAFMTTGFLIGWAKPVPVNFSRLKNIKVDSIKVVLAGPLSNFIMAIGWAFIYGVTLVCSEFTDLPVIDGMLQMAQYGISVNVLFFIFNLIPIPPLDGGRILQFMLPYKTAQKLDFLEQYGMYIIMALAFTGIFGKLIRPLAAFIEGFLQFIPVLFMLVFQMN